MSAFHTSRIDRAALEKEWRAMSPEQRQGLVDAVRMLKDLRMFDALNELQTTIKLRALERAVSRRA